MFDILSFSGLMQMLGAGFALLAIMWLWAKRSNGRILPLYALLWVFICVGWAAYGYVQRGQYGPEVLINLLAGTLLPILAAWTVQRWLLPTPPNGSHWQV